MLAVVNSMTTRHNNPVLLCYDGSDQAAEAIQRAGALMGGRSATVLHVTGRRRTTSLAEDGRRLALDAGFDPVSVVDDATGAVAGTILSQAEAGGVAAIVVGSRGRSSASSPMLGSVSSRVAHHARHPCLVVRQGADRQSLRGPVFFCYDGSDAAGRAIARAAALLPGRDAVVAYFLPKIDDGAVLRSTWPSPVSQATQDALAAADRDEALRPTEVAARGVAIAERAGLEARGLAVGDEGLAIEDEAVAWAPLSEAAAAEGASCIVVGHRRPAGRLSHLGSTAYGLVHHANRPVLVVPAD